MRPDKLRYPKRHLLYVVLFFRLSQCRLSTITDIYPIDTYFPAYVARFPTYLSTTPTPRCARTVEWLAGRPVAIVVDQTAENHCASPLWQRSPAGKQLLLAYGGVPYTRPQCGAFYQWGGGNSVVDPLILNQYWLWII